MEAGTSMFVEAALEKMQEDKMTAESSPLEEDEEEEEEVEEYDE